MVCENGYSKRSGGSCRGVEVDESFFAARRVKGKRSLWQDRCLRHLRARGEVYTQIAADCSKSTLQGIIRGRANPGTVVNSDGWRGCNGLVDPGYAHFRADRSRDKFARGAVHINGSEGFQGMAKVRLAKFKNLPNHTFHRHLKEKRVTLQSPRFQQGQAPATIPPEKITLPSKAHSNVTEGQHQIRQTSCLLPRHDKTRPHPHQITFL